MTLSECTPNNKSSTFADFYLTKQDFSDRFLTSLICRSLVTLDQRRQCS